MASTPGSKGCPIGRVPSKACAGTATTATDLGSESRGQLALASAVRVNLCSIPMAEQESRLSLARVIAIAIAALIISAGSLLYTARSANAARRQTAIQRQVREDAAQPYVWADVRPSEEHAQLFLLVVGNSGPTVATDVRVSIDKPLVSLPPEKGGQVATALSRGISALAPGRTMTWNLGVTHEVLSAAKDDDLAYTFRIEATGPFGALQPIEYTVDLETIRFGFGGPPGTLNGIAVAIKKLTAEISKGER